MNRRLITTLSIAALLIGAAVWFVARSAGDGAEPVSDHDGWRQYDGYGFPFTALEPLDGGCFVAFGGDSVWTADGDCTRPRPLWSSPTPLTFVDGTTARDGVYAGVLVEDRYSNDGRSYVAFGGLGDTWRTTLLPASGEHGTLARAIAWDGTAFVVLGTDGGVPATWSSADGVDWHLAHPPTPQGFDDDGRVESFQLAADGKGRLVASAGHQEAESGYTALLWWSDDSGKTWRRSAYAENLGDTREYAAIVHDGQRFVAVGQRLTPGKLRGNSTAYIATSTDGRTWTGDDTLGGCSAATIAATFPDGTIAVGTSDRRTDNAACGGGVQFRKWDNAWQLETAGPHDIQGPATVLRDGRLVIIDTLYGRLHIRAAA